ncbi:conserved hypothetical protein [Burkholderia sp. H160]|nr:conserved hypothetical protein [Burkholderia sp. H160]
MSLIVAARFTTFPAAESAAQKLFDAGFVEEDVTLFFVSPRGQHALSSIDGETDTDRGAREGSKGVGMGVTIGAAIGAVVGVAIFAVFSVPLLVSLIMAGVGAYVGSLIGSMSDTHEHGKSDHHLPYHEERRLSGVLVAVHVSPDNHLDAARVLHEAGGVTIEKASGRWQQGRWADFDPRKTPEPIEEFAEKHE